MNPLRAASSGSDGKWRVVVIEDDRQAANSLRDLLAASPEFECAGIFLRLETGLKQTAELRPDVVLFDLVHGKKECPEAIADLKRTVPGAMVLALTSYDDTDLVFRSFRAGADGYLLKTDPQATLVTRLREALETGPVLSRSVVRRVLQHFRQQGERIRSGPLATLSPGELRALELIYEGHTNDAIAAKLDVTVDAVKKRLATILRKLRVENRTQAAWLYAQTASEASDRAM